MTAIIAASLPGGSIPTSIVNYKRQYSDTGLVACLNRAGFAGGSNFQIGWSHDEQDDEQIFHRSPRPRGADGFGSRRRAPISLGGRFFDSR
ncbi:protein of unknown function [Methylocella tundrae]|uniref:Uncharacterized protein n=1 Tax=Methylocella tundrae TaxID=227605 RepID=A0A4U8Z0T5_METTU|nr:protein of unknown function [Methylocella tundrae]